MTKVLYVEVNFAFASANLQIFACGGITNGACNNTPTAPGIPALVLDSRTFTGDFTSNFSVASNAIYEVNMVAQVDTVDSFDTKTASAAVDPKVGFNPLFDADQYQLSFSDIVSSSPVPGPIAGAGRR